MSVASSRLERDPRPPQGQQSFSAHTAGGEWMFDLRVNTDLIDDDLMVALLRFVERQDRSVAQRPALTLISSSG